MPHHAEDVLDTPVDHRLEHQVANRPDMGPLLGQAHIDTVVADFDRKRRDAVIEARRFSCQRVKIPAVPRATQQAVLDRAFAKRATLVRALISERCVLAVEVSHAQRQVGAGRGLDAPFGKLIGTQHPVPNGGFRTEACGYD